MAPGFSASPVREILEDRFLGLLPDLQGALEAHFASEVSRVSCEVRAASRDELADQLNQAARRIRQTYSAAETGTAVVDAAAAFAGGVALLRINRSMAHGERARGLPEDRAAVFASLEIPLERAPALAEAIRTLDPVTAIATPGEISAELASLLGQGHERVFLYPLSAGTRVPAMLCAWGEVQGPAIELLSQIAAASLGALPAPAELVQVAAIIKPEAPDPAPKPQGSPAQTPKTALASTWDALTGQEQQLHFRAQRAARVEVAGIRLYEAKAVQAGRENRNLYGALRERIDAARESFRKTHFSATPTMVDYLHLELLRTLAHDDPDLLGEDYPGPLA
jgi:hypothetical protein